MKKTMVSLAAVAALTTGAMAADKGIDIVTTGQAVVYYQTVDKDVKDDKGFFDDSNSKANVGVQLNLNADLKNNFTFGSQLTYIGTAGLEKNLVDAKSATGGVMQSGGTTIQGSTTDDIALTKIFVAKKVANTTVKIGRQELPKSLSPLAFSEGWNVYKNTFDAILAVNTDIPNTTLVGAYVSGGTAQTLGNTSDLSATVNGVFAAQLSITTAAVTKGAYMLTAQTTVIPMTTFTASYYTLHDAAATETTAIWLDAKIADKSLPMGLTIGAQYGNLDIDIDNTKDTTAYGLKVSAKPMPALTLCAAYTSVDDGVVAVVNTGTGVKTPLYTQMIANQNAISSDADTYMVKAAYTLGDMGTFGIAYSDTSAGDYNRNNSFSDENKDGIIDKAIQNDYNEFDFTYKVKAGGVSYLAAYVMTDYDNDSALSSTHDTDIIRFWARYNF
jgi:hypothetical protein